ncbi:MAG: lycopene cyclase domain-containing protein [Bacteroidales bacterium]|jgi:lycopene cyclase domain-containing protein|nr:lycopene cyclase domain-containing protein [Bacteroidales bacterium]
MSLYLALLLASFSMPFLLSFDRKVAFHRLWRYLFPAIVMTALFFIPADILFTRHGVWGFNPRYHMHPPLAGLPPEEWLFFLVIPYASIFIHYVFISYCRSCLFSDRVTRMLTLFLIFALVITAIAFMDRIYTVLYSLLAVILLVAAVTSGEKLLNYFYLSFLIILIPFFIVNGVLTGTFIEEEVVWYNSAEITGLRLITVPVEDVIYGFCMILLTLLIMNWLRKRFPEMKS